MITEMFNALKAEYTQPQWEQMVSGRLKWLDGMHFKSKSRKFESFQPWDKFSLNKSYTNVQRLVLCKERK